MAKRFQPMNEFGRSMKKPKLDIGITNRTTTNVVRSTVSKLPSAGRIVSPTKNNPNNFWDDDDDDVILLATQKAEAAVAAKQNYDSINNITESEITFSEFANEATTSTQRLVEYEIPDLDILSQMFNDDDADLELLAAVEKTDPSIFKKPAPPPPFTQSKSLQTQKHKTQIGTPSSEVVEFVLSQNTGPESTLPSSQSAARRQLASERQIKFLMEKVDILKKENSKLNNDLTEARTKATSKEGEASLLRDELRHLKQEAQNLRVEKILSAKNVKNECQSKINEMAKVVEGKNTEVKLKAIECSLVKMRYDTTHRLQQSICDVSIRKAQTEQKQTKLQLDITQLRIVKTMIKIPTFNISSSLINKMEKCSLNQIHPLIYEHCLDKGSSKKQRTLFQLELENIQTKLAQLQLLGPGKLPKDFIKFCLASVCKVLPEFWSYTHSLEFSKNRRTHPYHDYSLINTKFPLRASFDSIRCLQEPTELYDDERCLCLRRYIAALAFICQQIPDLSNSLIEYKHSEYYLLQIVTDSVMKLSISREICEHFGVLEAFAVLLNSLLKHVSLSMPHKYVEMLFDLMKSLVFARPTPWIFREISTGLRQCCRLPYVLELLCINSAESAFVADRVRSTYRFSNESCFMQVYCGLLEIAFPLCIRLHNEHLQLLTTICLNHIRLIYHCFQKPPTFIQNLLPLYDDDEDASKTMAEKNTVNDSKNNKMIFDTSEQGSAMKLSSSGVSDTSTRSTRCQNKAENCKQKCECYVKLCLSVVTLIFQLLRQWLIHKKEYCTAQISEISRVSVQLLHTIFCDNYLAFLFRESEETTKHYLSLVIKWWSNNSKQLQFNEIDLKFLQKLKNSHVLPKSIIAETNYQNIVVDLSEWQKCTNEDIDHLKPPLNVEEALNSTCKLKLIQNAANQNNFFEGIKGYTLNC
ncbi:hypothetical protein DOY81_000041 [Sarcophaga bullata]|nr:hypothetical protein DOY81_000041 [Sarcophaga bullata]